MAQKNTQKNTDYNALRMQVIACSRNYGWKDGDIARRFAEDICELADTYGADMVMDVLRSLKSEWDLAAIHLDDAFADFGVGLDFWLHDVGIISPVALTRTHYVQ